MKSEYTTKDKKITKHISERTDHEHGAPSAGGQTARTWKASASANDRNHPVATRDCPLRKHATSRLGCIALLSASFGLAVPFHD